MHPIEEIDSKQLHHLLRLSALPKPKSAEEETKMLSILHSQLYFVRDIQNVDTEGVEALQRISDETEEGMKENTIGMKDLVEAFGKEEIQGRNRRPRRVRFDVAKTQVEDWDVLGTAKQTVRTARGSYFVVNGIR